MISFAYHKHFENTFDTGERSFKQTYLLYASAGSFHLDVAGRHWLLPPYRAALIAADVPIRIWTNAAATSSSVLFAPGCIEHFSLPCQVFRVTPLITEMTQYATRWGEQLATADAGSQSFSQLFFKALANVVSEASTKAEDLWLPVARSVDLIRAVNFTLANLGESLNFADVANVALTSERTLSRRFTEEMTMGWTEFVQRARIVQATEKLVRSDAPVGTIALDAGFPSASSFAATFKQVMGETPTRFRRRLT